MTKYLKRCLPILIVASLLSGCGFIDYFYLPMPEDTALELFEAGSDAMREEQYYEAIEYFTKLIDHYPFSPYTPQAEIGLGDAYYLNKDYVEAVDAYKEFEVLHPRHEEIPYVLLQIGVASHDSYISIDLQPNVLADGLQYLYQLVEVFPESPYVDAANEYIVKCRTKLAEHELFVADFFWRTDRYVAAWKRYSYVVDNYGDLPDIHAYAQKKAELAYLRYQELKSDKEKDREQGSLSGFFNSFL